MNRYQFEFISSYGGKSDYRLFINGRANTRFTVDHATNRLAYADGSAMLWDEVRGFQDFKDEQRREALARYPEYASEPFMKRHEYRPAPAKAHADASAY